MSPLQIAKAHCANFQSDGLYPLCKAKTEQEIAELYCQPRFYWRSVLFLEAPKYLALTERAETSRAAKQLFRLVEEARRELRDAQDRAWGNRKVGEQTPEDYDRKEIVAWRKFCKAKQKFLRQYNRAVHSGVVKRVKRKEQRICPNCGKEPLLPRRRKCDACRRAARWESVRQSKKRHLRKQLTVSFT